MLQSVVLAVPFVTKPATHMLDFGVTFAVIHDTTQPTVHRCRRNRQILHDSYAFRACLSDIVITCVILARYIGL